MKSMDAMANKEDLLILGPPQPNDADGLERVFDLIRESVKDGTLAFSLITDGQHKASYQFDILLPVQQPKAHKCYRCGLDTTSGYAWCDPCRESGEAQRQRYYLQDFHPPMPRPAPRPYPRPKQPRPIIPRAR